MSDTLRDQLAEVLRDRLYDLGVDGRDAEGTPDGSLWLESVQATAVDLAGCVAEQLAALLRSDGAGDRDRLFGKYHVRRTDGRDQPGRDKAAARYFVLDFAHDPAARAALRAYADACEEASPGLAADLRAVSYGGTDEQ